MRAKVRPRNNLIGRSLTKGIVVVVALFSFLTAAHAQSNQLSPVGSNLMQSAYWTVERPFLNIFKSSGGWNTQKNNGNGTFIYTGEQTLLYSSFLDPNGYPTTLTGGPAHNFDTVTALIYQGPGINYPSGQYLFLYDGAGTFSFEFDASVASSTPGRIILNVNATVGGIRVHLTSTGSGSNYAKNFRLVYCGTWNGSSCSSGYDTLLANGEMFNPAFLNMMRPYKTIRMMWWADILYSRNGTWANRIPWGWFTWADDFQYDNTVPIETQIALCNELNADCWFNMPFLSDDNYVTQFATLAHSTLKSNLKVYVEYGNELWNSGAIAPYIYTPLAAIGHALIPQTSNYSAILFYGVVRAVQNGATWKSVWGADSNRVVRLLGGQNGNSGPRGTGSFNESLLTLRPETYGGSPSLYTGFPWQNIDAFTTAPYFGNLNYGMSDSNTLDDMFTEIFVGGVVPNGYRGGFIKQAVDFITADISLATGYGLPLYAYEGGQNFYANPNTDPTLVALYQAANRDPRMGTAYTTFFNNWKALGGELFVNFTDVGDYSQGLTWGTLENIAILTAPKYTALTSFIATNPCWWSGCSSTTALGPVLKSTPPATPTGLTDNVASSSQINTSWSQSSAGTYAVAGYNVLRNGTKIGTTASTSYQDTGLAAGATYTYSVAAFDTAGNTSAQSSPVSATTPTQLSVAISSPTNGTVIRRDDSVNIASSASNANRIHSMTIKGDSNILQTCTGVTSCSATWHGKHISMGTHVITATAIDQSGSQASTAVTILTTKEPEEKPHGKNHN